MPRQIAQRCQAAAKVGIIQGRRAVLKIVTGQGCIRRAGRSVWSLYRPPSAGGSRVGR